MSNLFPVDDSPEISGNTFDSLPRTSNFEGIKTIVGDSVAHDYRMMSNFLQSKLLPTKNINFDEWRESAWFDPRLAERFKNGTNEVTARLAYEDLQNQDQKNLILDNMRPGIMSTVSRGVGHIGGFAASAISSPLALGSLGLTRFIMGRGAAKLFNVMNNAANPVAREAAEGALSGTIFSIPQSAAELEDQSILGENPDYLSAVASIGLNAGLGATIGGFLGRRQVIQAAAHRDAIQSAIEQMANGKRVDVDVILKDGFNQQKASEFEATRVAEENPNKPLVGEEHGNEEFNALDSNLASQELAEKASFIDSIPDENVKETFSKLSPKALQDVIDTISNEMHMSAEEILNNPTVLKNIAASLDSEAITKLNDIDSLQVQHDELVALNENMTTYKGESGINVNENENFETLLQDKESALDKNVDIDSAQIDRLKELDLLDEEDALAIENNNKALDNIADIEQAVNETAACFIGK